MSVDCCDSTNTEVLPEEEILTARLADCRDSTDIEVLPEEDHVTVTAMSVDC